MSFEHEPYTILVHKKFAKVIDKKLPAQLKKVLNRKLNYLKDNPRHPSLNTKALNVAESWCHQRGIDEVFEFRINMGFRCVFYVSHARREIILAFVGNHDDIKKHVQ